MKPVRRATLALVLAALGASAAVPARAQEVIAVDATVSMVAPCLFLSTWSLDYGPQTFSPDGGPPVRAAQPISFTNCSGATERVFARGTNATELGGPATWSLVVPGAGCPELGTNRFGLIARASAAAIDVQLAPQDRLLDLVPPGSGGQFDQVLLHTPCRGSDGAGSTMSFQVLFTATF